MVKPTFKCIDMNTGCFANESVHQRMKSIRQCRTSVRQRPSGVSLSFCAGGQWGFSARHF